MVWKMAGGLEWHGDRVEAKVVRAAKLGVNQTMSEASAHAKNNHPWRNRTGVLEGSIRPVVAAHERGDEIVGVWGSVSVLYAVFMELGFTHFRSGKRVGPFPFLRPAADAVYPRLMGHIKRFFGAR